MSTGETADELRMKLANYKRTRQHAAVSFHCWLDALINDTEAKLSRISEPSLLGNESDAANTGQPSTRPTYPLDDITSQQRHP